MRRWMALVLVAGCAGAEPPARVEVGIEAP